jgi:hypothetical protein
VKANPAVPARDLGQIRQARITPGHADRPEVRAAREIGTTAQLTGEPLGRGNFGATFRVDAPDGSPRVVKLPVEADVHGRTWDRMDLRAYFIHEAGIAEHLRTRGHTVVPKSVFVDLPNGGFAIVREYGEIATLADVLDQLPAFERALIAVEADGVQVNDDLLVARRPDGSLFVADVGFWSLSTDHPPHSLAWLLRDALGALGAPEDVLDAVRAGSLAHPRNTRTFGGFDPDVLASFVEDGLDPTRYFEDYARQVDGRDRLGLYVPEDVRAELADQVQILTRAGLPVPDDVRRVFATV